MFCPDGVVDIPEACGATSAVSLQPGFESRSGRLSKCHGIVLMADLLISKTGLLSHQLTACYLD
jgi:hypothetical protein